MVTVDEETQAKEFLKRAEIRTMRKDLQILREGDALKERDKIVNIKTVEEQRAEQEKKLQAEEASKSQGEKIEMQEVLQKNENQEKMAEKDLKNYATEEERQKIFFSESNRLAFEKQIDEIDKQKDPALKLEKNRLLLAKRDQQAKLNSVIEDEKKLETEQKFIIEKEQTTAIPAQRKGLEQSRDDLDKKIQDVEKKRWEAEKILQDTDARISQIDASSEKLVEEKNNLREKIFGADKSLRDIYSLVMEREEEKRRGNAEEQIAKRESLAKIRLQEKENVQRAQRFPGAPQKMFKDSDSLNMIPKPVREKIAEAKPVGKYAAEEEQRNKFMQDVDKLSDASQSPAIPVPPAPKKQ